MEGNRWVKFWESITQWEWYKDANTARLFFHLVIKAQYKDTRWQGYDIPRGCVVTSFKRLEEELGLSTQNLRTAIKHLIKSENIENLTYEITNIKKANFTIYKVNNYDSFQGGNEQDNKQLTNGQQTPNKQLTTYKKDKKERSKEIKNIYIAPTSNEAEPVIIEIPTNRNGEYYPVTQKMVDDWQELYPNVNILQELRKAKGWSLSNPAKRKTFKGMSRFLNSWFSREQDKNSYNQINQRKEDLPF